MLLKLVSRSVGALDVRDGWLRNVDTKKNPEKKTPPYPPAGVGGVEQLQFGGVGESQDEQPKERRSSQSSKPKTAAKDPAKDPGSKTDVGHWLRTFKNASEEEVTYVPGELDKGLG